MWRALKPGGVVYASYKLGDGPQANERLDELGRPFTDADAACVVGWLQGLLGLGPVDTWITGDQRAGQNQAWVNALVRKASGQCGPALVCHLSATRTQGPNKFV